MKLFDILNSKQIKTAAIGSLVIKFLTALFAFLNSILLARILGLELFGIYALALAAIMILVVPVSFGLPNLLLRYVSKYDAEKNYAYLKGLLIRANQFVISSTLIIWFLAFISYFFWWGSLDEKVVQTICYGFFLLPLIVFSTIRSSALRGLRYIIIGQISDLLIRNILLFLGILFFYMFSIELTPASTILIHIFAAAISFIVGTFLLNQKLKNKFYNISPIYNNSVWIKETIPFSLNEGIKISKEKISSFILAIFHSVESVAIFDIAIRASSLVSFTLDAINSAIAPYISNSYEIKNEKKLQHILKRSSRIIFITALPVILIFVFGGKTIIELLFGKEYLLAYVPLLILCVGQLANSIAGSVGVVLIMTGNQAYFTKTIAIITVIYLILNIPIVYYFDVVGAAINMSLLIFIQNIIFVVYVKNKLKLNTTIF